MSIPKSKKFPQMQKTFCFSLQFFNSTGNDTGCQHRTGCGRMVVIRLVQFNGWLNRLKGTPNIGNLCTTAPGCLMIAGIQAVVHLFIAQIG